MPQAGVVAMLNKRLDPPSDPKGLSIPVVGWWRPVDALLIAESKGREAVEWIVVDLALDGSRVQYGTEGLLNSLVALAEAPADEILAFARRYGIPQNPVKAWRQFLPGPGPTDAVWRRFERGNWWGMEVSKVRYYAGLLRAVLRLHRAVQTTDRIEWRHVKTDAATVREFIWHHGLAEDLDRELRAPRRANESHLSERSEYEFSLTSRVRWKELQRGRVAGVLNWWLERGKVHTRLVVLPNGRLAVRWTRGLWGVLGGELLYSLRREGNVAVCDYCDREFRLSRRPRRGAQTRCCERLACQREYRTERMRQARAKTGFRA
jgi:hypothetical protein